MRPVVKITCTVVAILVVGSPLICGCLSNAVADELPAAAEGSIEFVRDVQPLLRKHCWSCHGSELQESGLRLDLRANAMLGGDSGKAIVPGNSAASRLVQYVSGLEPDSLMPPEGQPLSSKEIGMLRAWIDRGAPWPDSADEERVPNRHWAYQPLRPVPPPEVQNPAWVINPIDQFILAELEKRQLSPSPPAERATLIRRLSLDLLGLLPTLAEVDAFVNDTSRDAYEEVVDRLLNSPHFGERWGRHWLDVARYADSDGYEKDNPRPDAYRWRDWVIAAINDDMPFDQFTIEQLAGDLLPNASDMQRLATAFHRQTLTNTEGGTDQEQFRVEACFDRTETTGAVWLGLTIGCARCHSHKYDAISQREYYQLFAFFNNSDESTHVVSKSAAEVRAYQQAKTAHDQRVKRATAKLRVAQQQLEAEFTDWQKQTATRLAEAAANPLRRQPLQDTQATSDAQVTFTLQEDGSYLLSGDNPDEVTYTILGKTTGDAIDALRLDVLADPSLPAKGPGRTAHGNFVLSEISAEVSHTADFADPVTLEFDSARADHEQSGKPWLAQHAIDGDPATGWAIAPQFGSSHWAEFRLKQPLPASKPAYIRVRLHQHYGTQHTIGRFVLSLQSGLTPDSVVPAEIAALLAEPSSERSAPQRQQLLDHFSSLQPTTRQLTEQLDALKQNPPPKPELKVRVLTERSQSPRVTHVLRRGEFLEPLADVTVQAAGLDVLPKLESRSPKGMADRLDLARWLVAPENPLTPRVTVNHVWRQLFGAGIVKTASDFGVRGDPPTHPALLDWLAASFVGLEHDDNGSPSAGRASHVAWSRKALIKRIVMSATYRQSSQQQPALLEADPQNQWLARQNRVRIEGEIVRDISLDVADLLDRRVGGPSVFPNLPAGIAELSYAGNFKWNLSPGGDRYRRGMYTFFKRTSPHPNLITFDCPDANLTCVDRNRSNTPLQALVILNNSTFAEAAQALAKRILSLPATSEETNADAARLTTAFRWCLSRPPTDFERIELQSLLATARSWYAERPEQAAQLVGTFRAPTSSIAENAAWVTTARILLNLDEFITRE